MPQTTYLPVWRAEYPLLCVVQKPGGVTVATNAAAPRVPNKPTYTAGTIQLVQLGIESQAEPQAEEVAGGGSGEETSISSDEEVIEPSSVKRKRK